MAHIAVQTAELEEEAEILNSGGILPYTPRQFPGISRGGSVTRPGTLRRTGTHKASSLSQAASPAEDGVKQSRRVRMPEALEVGELSGNRSTSLARSLTSRSGSVAFADKHAEQGLQSQGSLMQSTLPRTVSMAYFEKTRRMQDEAHLGELAECIAELEQAKLDNANLKEEVQKRQDSYLRRERALETEVAQLKHSVAILRGENATTFLEASEKGQAQQAKQISDLYQAVMLGLNEVERRENEVASPADIRALRTLRTRLTEMEKEVVRQHERKLQDESQWMQRTQAIRSELETLRGVAAAADTQARQALAEAQQSRRDAELLRQERALLVQQAVTLQQERDQLEADLKRVGEELKDWEATMRHEALLLRDQVISQGSDTHKEPDASALAQQKPVLGSSGSQTVRARQQRPLSARTWQDASQQTRHQQVLTSLQKQLRGERRRAVAAEEALSEFQAQQGAWGALLHELLKDVQQQRRQQLEDPVLKVTGAEGLAEVPPQMSRPTTAVPQRRNASRPGSAPAARRQKAQAPKLHPGLRIPSGHEHFPPQQDKVPVQPNALTPAPLPLLTSHQRQQLLDKLGTQEHLLQVLIAKVAQPAIPRLQQHLSFPDHAVPPSLKPRPAHLAALEVLQ
eukprot:jgi/Astpho2/7421/fgenesh1_pg.00114_%23_49_t